jgi:hypothetical protein
MYDFNDDDDDDDVEDIFNRSKDAGKAQLN